MTKHRCERCDREFRNVRQLWNHKCPAYAIKGRTAIDEARQRFYRRNSNARPPGRI